MDRSREARRAAASGSAMAASNGLARRRHRTSLRDSPGPVELPETRDRGRNERDRDRSKRRRAERLIHGDDDTSEDDDEDDDGGSGHMRVLPPPPPPAGMAPSSLSNRSTRRSFSPAAAAVTTTTKMFRPRMAADEMIGVSVPRKARSASMKRSNEWLSSRGLVGMAVMAASPVQALSPSSSNGSAKKKTKANGLPRPPKSSSSDQDQDQDQEEIEIEIAQVLYGMMRQPQVPPSNHEAEAREESRFSSDVKSRISSSISSSPSSALPPASSITPLTVIAHERKMLRPTKYEDESQPVRNGAISAPSIPETNQAAMDSSNLDRVRGSAAVENGRSTYDLSTVEPEPVKPEAVAGPNSRLLWGSKAENREAGVAKVKPPSSAEMESGGLESHDDERVDSMKATKANEMESQREEKFQIDLMAPPLSRPSPERDGHTNITAQDPKPPPMSDVKTEAKTMVKDAEKSIKTSGREQGAHAVSGEDVKDNSESHKDGVYKENIDLQFDLEKATNNKVNQIMHKQQHTQSEKTAQSATNSLSFPMPVAGLPGSLPPMGYMTPLPGVVSMDGSSVAPSPVQLPQWLFNQPPPKKCATQFYIARNIQYHQQLTRMNPFWPAAAGSASLFCAKHVNPNMVPPAEALGRAGSSLSDKAPNLGLFPGKEGKPLPPANNLEPSQRKEQILLQQTLPPGAPSNILGPAFIFPLTQQHAAAVRPGSAKAHNPVNGSTSTSATVTAAPTTMSFNYPNVPGGETQYLAILQNNAYPFPVPSQVGAASAYQGPPAQAMPFFSGSFYSSQMLHPSQLPQQPPPAAAQAAQSGHQRNSVSNGSMSSQKHLQNQQQQRPVQANGGNGSLQGFPASTNGPSSQQQSQTNSSHHIRPLEHEAGAEDSPLSANSRRSNMSFYSPNFTMVSPNFALMSAAHMAGSSNASLNNTNDKKQQQQQHQQHLNGAKAAGFDSLPNQAFAMPFSSLNSSSTPPNLDISSIGPNHPILQSLPEATRHSYQLYAAAAAQTAQKKNYRPSDEGKGNDAASEEERKTKGSNHIGQSIAFSRQDLMGDAPISLPGPNVVDSSAHNLGSASARSSSTVMPPVMKTLNTPASQQQLQRNNQQQIMQLQKQHQFAAAAARSNTPGTSNTDQQLHLPPFSSAAIHNATSGKSASALSPFQPNLVQTGSSPNQSPQWKSSRGTQGASQVPSALNSSSALKNHNQQQQGRPLQGQTQISFAAANSKGPNSPQVVGQHLPISNQSSSPPLVVGSPTTSSMSKSTGGSPRTTASAGNKTNQGLTLSTKTSSPQMGGHKSSASPGPVPSILGNTVIMTSSGGGMKQQLPQQLPKQPTQLFFNHPYVQAQPTSSSAALASSGYYQTRRNGELKSSQQQPPLGSAPSSSGMLSICSPVSLAGTSTCDPVKAVAASNMKDGGFPPQGILHASQFAAVTQSSLGPQQIVPAGFPYVHHSMQSAVHVKAADQKQAATAREESR